MKIDILQTARHQMKNGEKVPALAAARSDEGPPDPDVAAIARIPSIPLLLETVCEITSMRYAVVARVTPNQWKACAVLDRMDFGVASGEELAVATTLCKEVCDRFEPIVVEHASRDPVYSSHPTPKMYGIESYIAVPIQLASGEIFGTLCAIDPNPATLSGNRILETFTLFAGLIAAELDRETRRAEISEAEERYRAFIGNSSEGIWRCELDVPMDTSLPVEQQVRHLITHSFVAECNEAMARQYGFASPAELAGIRITELWADDDAGNDALLRVFIANGYKIENAETHELDVAGRDIYFVNNFVGVVENGFLVRAWGVQRDVTGEKSGRQTLAHLAAVVGSSGDAIISTDKDSRIVSWNRGAEALFGYTAAEAVGSPITLIHPHNAVAYEAETIQRALAGESVESYETRRRRKDGVEVDVSLTVSPVRDESGRVIGVSKIARDITRQKAAEQTIEESRTVLAMALESSSMGVWERDLASDTVIWSPELEAIFGLPEGGFKGSEGHFFELIHEDDRERVWATVAAAVAERTAYSVEFRFYHADGSIRWMEGRGKAVYSQSGEPVRLYGTGIDITERKRLQQLVAKSEERFRALVTAGSDMIFRMNADWSEMLFLDGRGFLANKSGPDPMWLATYIPAEDRPKIFEAVQKAVGNREPFELEHRVFTADSKYGWIYSRAVPLFDENGEITEWFGAATDVTDLRFSEQRVALLAQLSELIRRGENAERLMFDVSVLVGEHFEARRCFFNEIDLDADVETVHKDYCRGVPSVIGQHRISEYSSITSTDMAAGKTVINRDSKTDPRTRELYDKVYAVHGERSYVAVPLLRTGKWSASLWISDDKPREWSEFDVELLETAAERTWLAVEKLRNERAMRESEEMFAMAFNSSAHLMTLTTLDEGRYLSVNDAVLRSTGYTREEMIGRTADEIGIFAEPEGRAKLVSAFRDGIVSDLEIRLRTKSGEVRLLNISANIITLQGVECVLTSSLDITDSKRAAEALRESEERFSKAFNSSPLAITITSLSTGKLIEVNDTFVRMTGYSRDEAIGRSTMELGLWNRSADREAELELVSAAGRIRDREYAFRMRDGSVVIGLLSAELIDIGGEKCALTVIQDITERKRSEEELQASEERYRAVVESQSEMLCRFRPDGTILFVNTPYAKAVGATVEELLAGNFWQFVSEADRADVRAMLDSLSPDNPRVQIENRFETSEGPRWTLWTNSALKFDEDGRVVEAQSTGIDVTERKLAQERLIVAERRAVEDYQMLLTRIVPLGETLGTARNLTAIYRAMLNFVRNSMPCSGFFVSFYEPADSTRRAAYVWGTEGEVGISGLPPMQLTEDGGPNSQAVFQRRTIITSPLMKQMEGRPHVIVQEDGRDPLSSMVVPMIVMGRVIGTLEVQAYEAEAFGPEQVIALGMVANLAAVAIENVRLIEQEAKAREAAEGANRAKDEFLSVLSHELRTPLNSILGWVRMMRLGALDASQSEKALEVIDRNTRHQSSLIEDLLDVSRIISGQMRVEKAVLDLDALLRETVEGFKPAALAKKIDVSLTAPGSPVLVEGDPVRLQQVITNLLQNALKFTGENGRITVAITADSELASIAIRDTGIGIEPEFLPFIFDRFRQADASVKRSFTGLGLGLTIVRTIVELHGGTITADSAGKGRGASFTVSIPLAAAFYGAGSGSNGSQELTAGRTLAGARILLVDDDAESLLPVMIFLQQQAADVVATSSAADALRELAEQDFDLMISDIGMPTMDGYELLKKIRRSRRNRNSQVPAIALTAYASAEHRALAFGAGFQAHLAKPLNFETLLDSVRRLCRKPPKA
jgi:PAS domain S-box-containing protein